MVGFVNKIRKVLDLKELGLVLGAEPLTSTTYTEVDAQVAQLYDMYTNAKPGGALVRAVCKFKASSVMSSGLSVNYTGDKDVEKSTPAEVEYIEDFIDYNNINQGRQRSFIIASQLEARCLVKMVWTLDSEGVGRPKMIYIPYETTKYEFETDPSDPETILSVKYKIGEEEVDEPFDDYAYVAFNALPSTLVGIPDMGVVIQYMIDIDEGLKDWRPMNRNFAVSTPYFECESLQEAEAMQSALEGNKWNKGRLMCGTAKFSLVAGSAGDWMSIEREFVDKTKAVSAAVAIPVQHLGLPDELSNRSTADSTDDPARATAATETDTWSNFYEDLFEIAIRMNNENPGGTHGQLEFNVVEPDTSGKNTNEYDAVEKVYLPMAKEGLISNQTLWELTPQIDSTKEAERISSESAGVEEEEIDGGETE